MLALARTSLRNRLLLIFLLSTLSALTVAAIALLAYQIHNYRQTGISDLLAQAEVLGRSTGPALAFDDPEAARQDLEALRGKGDIRAAAIFNREGRLFAGFDEDGLVEELHPIEEQAAVSGNSIQVVAPIQAADQQLGTVYLRNRYDIQQRIRDYVLILTAIMLPSLLIALAFSAQLQRSITRPMQALTDAANNVIKTREFSARVEKSTEDEIGVFVDAFNSMVEELGARAKALEAADRHKDEFLATLAHELRNPLSPMVNAITMMERSSDSNVRQKAREMLDRQVKHMVRLVNDLLDMSRISTGKLSVQIKNVDLRAILINAVETARPLCESLGHSLVFDPPRTPIWLPGDETRLAQVFTNLLDNAAKYTPRGGKIALCVEKQADGVAVRISDSGIGIARDKLAQVFGMFAQLENPLERMKSGLGVGLALAKRLVELHSGSIAVESEGCGKGATFTVRLPVPSQTSGESKEFAAASMSDRGEHWRILLVDDNVDYAVSLGFLLSSLGHEVRVLHDGASALRLLEEWRPDVACLDIGMPEINGYELARRIRAMPTQGQLTLVAVTGWGQLRDRELSRAAGFDHHLVKPVSADSVLNLIAAAKTIAEPLA